jgi:hypothetical protein
MGGARHKRAGLLRPQAMGSQGTPDASATDSRVALSG